jgi:4'-phosphopantetheinyl transferase
LALLDLKLFSLQNNPDSHRDEKKRELETAGIRFLLMQLSLNAENLAYTESKKPYLEGNNQYISISHSHDKLVVICNDKYPVGIDVELMRNKIIDIQHKFLSVQEIAFAENNVEKLTYFWAAKESLYKVYGIRGVIFIKDIFINNFNVNDDLLYGSLCINSIVKNYVLKKGKQQILSGYCLVYSLNEI